MIYSKILIIIFVLFFCILNSHAEMKPVDIQYSKSDSILLSPDSLTIRNIVFSLRNGLDKIPPLNRVFLDNLEKNNFKFFTVEISDFFPIKAEIIDTILVNYIKSDGMMGRSIYISISKDRKFAYIIDSKEKFNQFSRSLYLNIDKVEKAQKQAMAYLKIFKRSFDIKIIDQIPQLEKEKSKDFVSIYEWFETNEKNIKYHKPQITPKGENIVIKFYTHERLNGILKYHTIEMKKNGEIISHIEKTLGTEIGDWYII